MEIISHRGLWKKDHEKNSVKAFQRSFEKGFGTVIAERVFDIFTENSSKHQKP